MYVQPALASDDPPGTVELTTVAGPALGVVDRRITYPAAIAAMSSTSATRTSHASLGAL
jgi:hypothetical protein